jgi:alpha,alpha-trehalase
MDRRYREIYYWDSLWIMEGLLRSELESYARDLILNFMDLIDLYGFLPNGGRKYYLNRSQPPVFTQVCVVGH